MPKDLYIKTSMVMVKMKTTVLLRNDVYDTLVNKYGKRNISKTINEILFEKLVKQDTKQMFGFLKGKLKPFKREHIDRF